MEAVANTVTFTRGDVRNSYTRTQRALLAVLAAAAALLLAGFWNPRLVDGIGRDAIAGSIVGDSTALGFAQHGALFGFLFAAAAGLAATFTACNCVVFAMLPGLAAGGRDTSRRAALSALALFSGAVIAVGAVYGTFIGFLGSEGIAAFNTNRVRLAQANAIFSAIGVLMLAWGALELGFLDGVRRRASPVTHAFFAQPSTKATMLGLLVGAFAVGRPFPVMRDFLSYAAAANSPAYGAAVMMMQGLGQIAVMVALFLILVFAFGRQLTKWSQTRPDQVALVSALSLVAGGTFFVFYWGIARAYDVGRWGVRLGWY
jgi:sulfite exporter TauE/SafE